MASQPHAHATSLRTYLLVWGALILLTLLTVWSSSLELGAWHTPLGLVIAAVKGTLIVLIFMHALEGGRLVWIMIAMVMLFLAILFGFIFCDYATRRMDDAVRDPAPLSARP
jgi:cytochrome c oxidase subunit IV